MGLPWQIQKACPAMQQWPMRTDLFECLGVCTDGQYESRDSLLVLVPHSSYV